MAALRDMHLNIGSEFWPIRRGEFIMLRGPSGGGKTSLLNILGTIDKATSGVVGKLSHLAIVLITIEILGQPIDVTSTDDYLSQLRLEKIGRGWLAYLMFKDLYSRHSICSPRCRLMRMLSCP